MMTNRDALITAIQHPTYLNPEWAAHIADLILESDWLEDLRKQIWQEGRSVGFREGQSDANDDEPWEGTNPYDHQ